MPIEVYRVRSEATMVMNNHRVMMISHSSQGSVDFDSTKRSGRTLRRSGTAGICERLSRMDPDFPKPTDDIQLTGDILWI